MDSTRCGRTDKPYHRWRCRGAQRAAILATHAAPALRASAFHQEAWPAPAASLRVSRILFVAITALLLLFTLWWAGSGTLLADFGGDNAVYFLTANHYSPYGTAHAAAAEFAAHSVYPPLYPWLLAVSGGGTSLAAAHLVTAVLVMLAGAAVYALARAMTLRRGEALAIVTLCAVTRIVLLEGLELHSEHLYLLCWASAALLLAKAQTDTRALLLAAVAVGAAYLTRSFGLTLIASLWLWLAIKRPPRAWLAAAVTLLPLLYLAFTHSGNARYLHALIELYQRHGPQARLLENLSAVPGAWRGVFGDAGQAGLVVALPAALAAAALCGLALRLRGWAFDALSVLAYLTLMVVWPYPAEYERMCYPLLPFALVYAVLAARSLMPWVEPRLAAALPLLSALAANAPFALLVAERLATPPADPGLRPYTRSSAWFDPNPAAAFPTLGYQRAITEALHAIGQRQDLPRDACLLAIKPSVVALYSGRMVDGLPPFQLGDEEQRARLAKGRCRYLFMMMGASPSFPQYYYPYHRLKPWLDVLAVYQNPLMPGQPAALLARLRDTPRTP